MTIASYLRAIAAEEMVTMFVGAGASAPSSLPGWDALIARLLVEAGTVDTEDEAWNFVRSQDLFLSAEAALAGSSDVERAGLIRRALYGTHGDTFAPSEIHLATAEFMTQRGPLASRLLTVNFDDLLEAALAQTLPLGSTVHYRDSAPRPVTRETRYVVHHLHGVVPRTPTQNPLSPTVLTLSDFNQVINTHPSWQQDEINIAVREGALLLVATSYSDANLRLWLDALRASSGGHPGHIYVVVPRQSLRMGRDTFRRVRDALTGQWESLGITPLFVESFGDVAQVIRELNFVLLDAYCPPEERRAWPLLHSLDDFTAWQELDSSQLDEDAHYFKENLADANASLDTSLWLCDDAGRLVRWASHDCLYKDPETLRKEELTPESPWLAVQAACRGGMIVDVTVPIRKGTAADTTRWRSILAHPVWLDSRHGPRVVAGVVTCATDRRLDDETVSVVWGAALAGMADRWAHRLGERISD